MFTNNDRVCRYCNRINNDRDIHVKETELPVITTPAAPRARNTSDINEADAKALIASFASLDQIGQQGQPI